MTSSPHRNVGRPLSPGRQCPVMVGLLLAAGVAFAAPPQLPAPPGTFQPKPADLVGAKLLADVSAVAGGKPFRLGVLLEMAEEWHVYWRNPGDAGLATEIDWTLPEGFTAGPLQWPIPKTFRQEGGITSYGYEGAVLLTAVVRPPEKLPPGRKLEFAAAADWLACKVQCIPGRSEAALTLEAAADPAPANADLFTAWRKRLPVPAAKAPFVASAEVVGRIRAGEKAGSFRIDVAWKAPPRAVEFYPAAGRTLAVSDVAVRPAAGRTRVTFRVSSPGAAEPRAGALETVLVAVAKDGARRGVSVPVCLFPNPPAATAPARTRGSSATERSPK